MVSIVLLSTEEILQRNTFWNCLDTVWITEELEPFEEVKPEHVFSKPLSKDYYYAKYPEIPRSESEEEHSLTVNGFKCKHVEWKSKITIRRFEAKRRNSNGSLKSSNSNPSLNDVSRRVTSLVETRTSNDSKDELRNEERVRAFFNRLLESVPPPPIQDLHKSTPNNTNSSIVKTSKPDQEFNDIKLPDYEDFKKDKLLQPSTLKRTKRVSFNTNSFKDDFEHCESWYESIHGISAVMDTDAKTEDLNYLNVSISSESILEGKLENCTTSDYCASWSEIVNSSALDNNSIINSKESSSNMEEIISRSNCADVVLSDLSDDDDTGYARFAVYKIYQSLKIEDDMVDSSSMKNFDVENENGIKVKNSKRDTSFRSMYRLAPIDDVDKSVNVAFI